MKESLSTVVVMPNSESGELDIQFDENVLYFTISGKEVFRGDWQGNLEQLFWEALRNWGYVRE